MHAAKEKLSYIASVSDTEMKAATENLDKEVPHDCPEVPFQPSFVEDMVIFVPVVADTVGVFDPGDESFELIDNSAQLSSGFKFACAAQGATGKVILAPEVHRQ